MARRQPAINPVKTLGKGALTANKGDPKSKGSPAPTFGGKFGAKKGN